MTDRDCTTCARSDYSKGEGNGCTAFTCDYINRKEAIKAYLILKTTDEILQPEKVDPRELLKLEQIVHCPECRECSKKEDICGKFLYCSRMARVVKDTDHCSWGERR